MNASLAAELWAQDGVDSLCEPYRTTQAGCEIDLTEALALLRAAYAKGYSEALSEATPLDLPEAAARAVTLGLMLPV